MAEVNEIINSEWARVDREVGEAAKKKRLQMKLKLNPKVSVIIINVSHVNLTVKKH